MLEGKVNTPKQAPALPLAHENTDSNGLPRPTTAKVRAFKYLFTLIQGQGSLTGIIYLLTGTIGSNRIGVVLSEAALIGLLPRLKKSREQRKEHS
jgi:hypothetical protein